MKNIRCVMVILFTLSLAACGGGAAVKSEAPADEQGGAGVETGAAGGAGWGLAEMLGAELERGVDVILDAVNFADRCAAADLVLTGEGRLDAQSRRGKACCGVAERAAAIGVPVVAIVGEAVAAAGFADLFTQVISLSDRYGRDDAVRRPEQLIAEAVRELLTRRP